MDSKLKYYLQIADSAMVMSKRLKEQNFHVPNPHSFDSDIPFLESLQSFAQEIYLETSSWQNEHKLAFSDWLHKRKSDEFYNCLLFEIAIDNPYGSLVQHLFCETFLYLFLFETVFREDKFLKNIAEKYLPEFYNQLLHTQNNFENLSHQSAEIKLKVQEYVLSLWKYVDDLFQVSVADIEMYACQLGVDSFELRKNWELQVGKILRAMQVYLPVFIPLKIIGKEGQHTKNLESLLQSHS